jgi:hypothetical protein
MESRRREKGSCLVCFLLGRLHIVTISHHTPLLMPNDALRRENCYHSLSMQLNRNGSIANAYAKTPKMRCAG